jgi:FKBP-type peptidyl-prolyl cis-trans isomerase
MLRIFCLTLFIFFTTAVFSQNTKTASAQKSPVQKSAVPKPVLKDLRDSASYTAGIHVVNKYRAENIYNFNSAVVARCVTDIQSNKPPLIGINDADKIILAYQDTLKAKSTTTRKPAKPGTALNDIRDSASYIAGIYIVNFFRKFDITDFNSAVISRAIDDLQNKRKPLLNDSLANMAAMRYQLQLMEVKNKSTIEAGKKFLAENKKRPTVKVTKSGLQYEIITQGTGKIPTTKDTVSCNYTGSFIDGTEFNNSYKMGGPISFAVSGVIKGWTEALQMMPIGSKWKLFIPYTLGYGPGQYQAIPGGSALVFEIELLGIVNK